MWRCPPSSGPARSAGRAARRPGPSRALGRACESIFLGVVICIYIYIYMYSIIIYIIFMYIYIYIYTYTHLSFIYTQYTRNESELLPRALRGGTPAALPGDPPAPWGGDIAARNLRMRIFTRLAETRLARNLLVVFVLLAVFFFCCVLYVHRAICFTLERLGCGQMGSTLMRPLQKQ